MTENTESEPLRIAFVCVQNAGRSQMAYALAQREVEQRGLEDEIEIISGGTRPADHVHDEVVRAMHAVGIDISGRTPREITFEETQESDYVITMGCSADDVCPAGWAGENRDWDLDDPDGKSAAEVGRIRDEIQRLLTDLFDEVEPQL
jgi:arsenate reductase